ncbi:hypothetical protein AVEN_169247-1 [Araneus ventricosus]|uniref:Uncharacterized protein n=1 Tax=Araneus ventricosus TaxID=182803 RepID=A0A4Y2W6V5_ARAVE|nr:hypothetical protein AVEN_169247-1 [Araneus ventricosus]
MPHFGPRWPSGKVSPSGRRVPDSRHDSNEDPPCLRARCTRNITWTISFRWRGAKDWRVKCRTRHLTTIQNDEVRLKMVLEICWCFLKANRSE